MRAIAFQLRSKAASYSLRRLVCWTALFRVFCVSSFTIYVTSARHTRIHARTNIITDTLHKTQHDCIPMWHIKQTNCFYVNATLVRSGSKSALKYRFKMEAGDRSNPRGATKAGAFSKAPRNWSKHEQKYQRNGWPGQHDQTHIYISQERRLSEERSNPRSATRCRLPATNPLISLKISRERACWLPITSTTSDKESLRDHVHRRERMREPVRLARSARDAWESSAKRRVPLLRIGADRDAASTAVASWSPV